MKDSRIGESLWLEWFGYYYESRDEDSVVFYTNDHVDLDNDVVKRALASAVQREGIAVSLGEGYKMVESAKIHTGYSGEFEDELLPAECDNSGETYYGDTLINVTPTTWVEIVCQST
jgi:hypothetical protein